MMKVLANDTELFQCVILKGKPINKENVSSGVTMQV